MSHMSVHRGSALPASNTWSFRTVAVAAILFAMGPGPLSAGARSAPNIILISLDSLRADHLGCYGNGDIRTPVIDSLAEDGVLFKNAYSHATYTLPSHVSLFTSLLPFTHQVNDREYTIVPAKFPLTLTECLKKAGYRTAAFTGGGFVNADYGFGKGFDFYDISDASRFNIPVKKITDWIGTSSQAPASAQKPFFVFLHTFRIHNVVSGIRNYGNMYCASDDRFPTALGVLYDTVIAETDRSLGEIFQYLKSSGLYRDTIIVVFSDHGDSFCEEHDNGSVVAFSHNISPYQEQLHVPLVMKLPESYSINRSTVGKKYDPVVGLIDVAPTLLGLCGLEIPKEFQGRSLLPLIQGKKIKEAPHYASGTKYYAADFSDQNMKLYCAILYQNKKYIHYPEAPDQDEFYDLAGDPSEKLNLAGEGGRYAAFLLTTLKRAMKDYGWYHKRYREEDTVPVDVNLLNRLRTLGYLK